MKNLTNNQIGSLYCLISGLMYGLLGYFGIQIMNENISIPNMMFWRFLIASIIIFIIILPQIGGLNLKLKSLIAPFISGVVLYGYGSGIYFMACRYIGTGLSIIIFFTYPAIVIFCNWLLYKTKVTNIYYMSIFMILLGMILLVDKNDIAFDLYGISLAAISALWYALYILVSKKQTTTLPPLVLTLMVTSGSAVSGLGLSYFDGSFIIPDKITIWGNICGIAIICTSIPILFLLKGMKYISSEKASILSVLEPLGIYIVGITILEEKVNIVQTIGVVTILLGALLVQFEKPQS